MTTAAIGLATITRIRRRKAWNVGRGDHYVDTYKGPLADARTQYDAWRQSQGIDSVTLEEDRGVGTIDLIVQDETPGGGGQTTQALDEYWEVIPMEIYKPARSHPTFADFANQGQLEAVRRAVLEGRDITPAAGAPSTYRNLLQRGAEEYVRSQFVLQKTIEVGRRSAVAASWIGVDRAWKLNGEAGSPSPPSVIIGAISDHSDYDATKKQLLKKAPNTRQIARGRFHIVHSWWFSRRWSALYYSGDVEAGNP